MSQSLQCHKKDLQDLSCRKNTILSLIDSKKEKMKKEMDSGGVNKAILESKIKEMDGQRLEFDSKTEKILETLQNPSVGDEQEKIKLFERECHRVQQPLPIYAYRSKIVETVLQNKVCIIQGETGTGKSTQIVQYLLETDLIKKGKVVCTQPRKSEVQRLTRKISDQLKCEVGDIVDFKCSKRKKVSSRTKILLMTDCELLDECMMDPTLSEYVCIIIDEAHERRIHTDLLLGMIKRFLPLREDSDIHIVLAMATEDYLSDFLNFFEMYSERDRRSVVEISQRKFPVDIEWPSEPTQENFLDNRNSWTVEKIIEINEKEGPGNILAFFTSQLEIERCIEKLDTRLSGAKDNCIILPFHAKLLFEEQNRVFERAQEKRKIILATQFAETSMAIPNIRFVVDSGFSKELEYDQNNAISMLNVVHISRSSADRRKKIAGKTGPGICYRFYSKEEYDKMSNVVKPEISRINLGSAILKLLQFSIDPRIFDYIQTPDDESVEKAYLYLKELGAVEDWKITDLGKCIAHLPFEPILGVLVYKALDLNLGKKAAVIASSCMVSEHLFHRVGTEEEKGRSDKIKVQFCQTNGDFFTFLKIYDEWKGIPESKKYEWCKDNSINENTIRDICETVQETKFIIENEMKVEFCETSQDDPRQLQKLLFQIFKKNLCHYFGHEKAGYYFIDKNKQVFIHPSSSLLPSLSFPKWTIFEKLLRTSREYAINMTEVRETDVFEAIEKGELKFSVKDLTNKTVKKLHTEYVGNKLYDKCVRHCHQKVKEIEKKKNTNSVCVINTDKYKGEISIYAHEDEGHIAAIQNAIKPIRQEICVMSHECLLNLICETAIVCIGPGGVVKEIKHQYFFRLNVSWLRRKAKGYGFIEINDVKRAEELAKANAHIIIHNKRGNIKENKNGIPGNLFFTGLGELTMKDDVQNYLIKNLKVDESDIKSISVPRQKIDLSTEGKDLENFKEQLICKFEEFVGRSRFKVSVSVPQKGDAFYEADVYFNDPKEGADAYEKFRKESTFRLNGSCVSIRRYDKENEHTGSIASSMEPQQKYIEHQEKLDKEKLPLLDMVFTSEGRQEMERIMKRTDTRICLQLDDEILIRGREEYYTEAAIAEIITYISSLSNFRMTAINLKEKSPGLMRELIKKYGTELQKFKEDFKLVSADLEYKLHRIKILGPKDAVQQAVEDIEKLQEGLNEGPYRFQSNDPQCVVCFSQILPEDLYRLESCGHSYCKVCVESELKWVIRAKAFPIECYHEECNNLWAWYDIENMINKDFCDCQSVIDASVSCYVAKNSDKVRYCITPDCPMVYTISESSDLFVCPLCETRICCSCHEKYHSGISCKKYEKEKSIDPGVLEWKRQDSENRDFCTNCSILIEKNGGCQHVQCTRCKKHICWRCGEYFDKMEDCYGHLKKIHNSFV